MRLLLWAGIFAAALAGAVIGIFVVLPFGLAVHELVILPLAMLVGGLLAGAGASWAGARLDSGPTRPRLLAVVAVAEGLAALLALIIEALAAADAARPAQLLPPPGVVGIAAGLALALAASLAALRLREGRGAGGQARLFAALLGLAVLSIPATIAVAALFGLTGA
jgi:arsenical pump membrane protein